MTVVYEPIFIDGVSAVNSNLTAIKLDRGKLFADFSIDDKPLILRVSIYGVVVHRLIDGVMIPRNEIEPHVGLSPDNLGYTVEGSKLFAAFGPMINGHCAHYRFITGSQCLDVLAKEAPSIRTVGIAK